MPVAHKNSIRAGAGGGLQRRTRCGAAARQRGVAAVEFALVLPLLLGVLMAVIELGLMLYNQAVITQASREGARAGIVLRVPKPSDAAIREAALQYARDALVSLQGAATPTVEVLQSSPAAFPNPLRVTVRYPYGGLALGPLLTALDAPMVLSATTVMVNE
jgi:Flp pilus assembly protein TadG